MPPDWWLAQHRRTTRWYQYENGKRVAAYERRRGLGLDAAVPQDEDESTTERISHER